jgi:hypothetical protein
MIRQPYGHKQMQFFLKKNQIPTIKTMFVIMWGKIFRHNVKQKMKKTTCLILSWKDERKVIMCPWGGGEEEKNYN